MIQLSWNDTKVLEWKERSICLQGFYCNTLGRNAYETYGDIEGDLLKLKVGYALFSASKVIGNECEDLMDYKYSEEQERLIEAMIRLMRSVSETENIKVAFINLIAITETEHNLLFPVFRVACGEGPVFLDSSERVYYSWKDFIEQNKLPKCFYCYPTNGWYAKSSEGLVSVEFAESPECRTSRRLLFGLDLVNLGVSLGSTGVGLAALFSVPFTPSVLLGATLAGVTSGIWAAGRSVNALVDRSTHKQSLGLKDSEARGCWLDLASGIIGTTAVGITTAVGMNAVTKFIPSPLKVRTALISCNVASITAGSASIAHNLLNIAQKKASKSDIMHIAVAVFFFTSSILSLKSTAFLLNSMRPMRTKASKFSQNVPASLNFINVLSVICEAAKEGEKFFTNSLESPVRRPEAQICIQTKNQWTFVKNHLIRKISSNITLADYKEIFGELELENLFDHLQDNKASSLYKLVELQLGSVNFDFLIQTVIKLLKIKKSTTEGSEKPVPVLCCELIKLIFGFVAINEQATREEIINHGMNFAFL